MIKISYVLALVLLSANASAAEQSVSLYGVELGKPFTLPECPLSGQTAMCFQRTTGTAFDVAAPISRGERSVAVYFASGEMPSIVNYRYFGVQLSDGVVQQISIVTKGVSAQEDTLRQLTQKFGPPGSAPTKVMQNGFGATYSSVDALWHIGNYWLSFRGIDGRADRGSILALTDSAYSQIKAESAKEPKL
jgi:hypothetical protein